MAELNKETKATLGAAADKIGKYRESTGGGDPIRKGEKFKVADTPEEAEKMREADPDTKVRVNQPRNDDGTFGYNSQNARGLKYGPSRGTTVPDFLRGVDLAFLKKGSTMVMQGEKGIEYYLSTIDMTEEQLIENCKHYIQSEKGFAGMHEGMMVNKKGRRSKEEIARGQQLQEYREDKDKMSKEEFGAKYKGNIPSGIVPNKKVDISKLAQKTQESVAKSQEQYQKIEAGLDGLDAKDLGRSAWGTTAYNKKAVTEDQIDERKQWRDMIKNGNIRKVTGSPTSTSKPQQEAETVPSSYGKKSNFKFSGDASARKKAGDDILKELGIGVG